MPLDSWQASFPVREGVDPLLHDGAGTEPLFRLITETQPERLRNRLACARPCHWYLTDNALPQTPPLRNISLIAHLLRVLQEIVCRCHATVCRHHERWLGQIGRGMMH